MVNAVGGKGSTSLAPSGANKIEVAYKSATGWSSTATNPGITKGWLHCGVFIGVLANSPNSNVKIEGTPGCW